MKVKQLNIYDEWKIGLATHNWENILHMRQLELVNHTEHILCIYRYTNGSKKES